VTQRRDVGHPLDDPAVVVQRRYVLQQT
jgi:hypothetical protein